MLGKYRQWRIRTGHNKRVKSFLDKMPAISAAFSLDDPIVNRVHQLRKQNRTCALVLFSIENYGQMLYPGLYEQLVIAEQLISRHLVQLLPAYFADDQVLGVRNFHGEEYCVFLEAEGSDYTDLHYQSLRIRDELAKRLKNEPELYTSGELKFGVGFYIFEKEPASTKLAISIAYHYAQAIAANRLPSHFCHTRKQLSDIMEQEDIHVLAQPIMDLRHGAVFGWEVLTRGPVGTPFHSPAELFDYAYQANLLPMLEFLVIKKTFKEIVDRSISEQVFINVTSISLAHKKFYDDLVDYLELFPSIKPSQIIFEITERHSIRDYDEMAFMMAKYRKLGFRFALDDTGSGYASLQTISELIPDMIKIDRSLIRDIDQGKIKQSLLKALMQFARDIECEVIAEGIERQEEADIVYRHAVTKAQGFYFARPSKIVETVHFQSRANEMVEQIRLRAEADA